MNTTNETTAASSAKLKERLVRDAMADYERARGDRAKVFRRWLDDIYSYKVGVRKPIRDDRGNVLHTWGPPLAWFDTITNSGPWPRGMAADLDFFLERNGLYLVIEFKSADGERGKGAGDDKIRVGQWRSMATLAKTGLFVVYAVEYSDMGGNDRPPTIARVRRLTDDVAPARRWKDADYGDLLGLIHQWWANAGDAKFVRRQKAAACYSQTMQHLLRIEPFTARDSEESILKRRIQHEALRLTAREEREGHAGGTWADFQRRFECWVEALSAGTSLERSTA